MRLLTAILLVVAIVASILLGTVADAVNAAITATVLGF